ncbi:checkpoint protein Hus1/Mec3 [Melampsora americana]|nr:checkpoint protein Hus1/Mec3 [Melampsora americana]
MRFRAQVSNLSAFTKFVESVAKLSKRAVFKFTPTELKVISTGDLDDGVRFFGYGKGIRITENQILLELTTQALNSVLKASSGSRSEIVIRLGKNGKTPVLSFVTSAISMNRTEYELEQHIAVRVVKPNDTEILREPQTPVPDIQITLPKLADVCKVAERLKSLSACIQVSANRDGCLKLGIKSEHVDVETEWRGLILGPDRPQEQVSSSTNPYSQPNHCA